MSYLVHRAGEADLPALLDLVTARIDWLQTRGSAQWSTRDQAPLLESSVEAGDTWLMREVDSGRLVASLNLTTIGDPDFWAHAELGTPALYLSKLATHPNVRGRGLGALFIDWANSHAATWGVRTLRWDVWRTNHQLQAYYERLGMPLLRMVDVPGRWSGALYEVAYRPVVDLSGQVATEQQPHHHARLGSRISYPVEVGEPRDPLQDPPTPNHLHRLDDLLSPILGSPLPTEPRPLAIVSDPILVFHNGLTWCARQHFAHPIISWGRQPAMQPGRLYTITHDTADTGCHVSLVGEGEPFSPS